MKDLRPGQTVEYFYPPFFDGTLRGTIKSQKNKTTAIMELDSISADRYDPHCIEGRPCVLHLCSNFMEPIFGTETLREFLNHG